MLMTLVVSMNGQSTISKDSLIREANVILDKIDWRKNSAQENESICKAALQLFEQAEDSQNITRILNWLTAIYYYDQDYINYFDSAEKTLNFAKNNLPESDEYYLIALQNWAIVAHVKGNYRKAIELYGDYTDLTDTITNKIVQTSNFQNVGSLYKELGDYNEAINYFEQALRIRVSQNDPEDMDRIGLLSEIAQVYYLMGQTDKAIALNFEAINKADEIAIEAKYLNQIYLYCFQDLAKIFLEKEELPIAKKWVDKAMSIQKGESFMNQHESFLLKGNYHIQNQNFNLALSSFQQALKIAKESFSFRNGQQGDQHPISAKILLQLSDLHIKLKQFSKAKLCLTQAFNENSIDAKLSDLYEFSDNSNWIDYSVALESMRNLVRFIKIDTAISSNKQKLEAILKCYENMHQLIQQIRLDYETQGSKSSLMADAKSIYEEAILVCFQLFQETNEAEYVHDAFIFSEASRAVQLLESRQEQIALAAVEIPDSIRQEESSINHSLSFYRNRIAFAEKEDNSEQQTQIKIWKQQLFELKEKQKAFVRVLESEYPQYHQLREPIPLATINEVQEKLLDESSALISYFMGSTNSFGLLISKSEQKLVQWKNTAQINSLVTSLQSRISNEPSSSKFESELKVYSQESHLLYTSIWEEFEASIPETVQRITILSDGLLNYLPFETFVTEFDEDKNPKSYLNSDLEYLLERFQFSYDYSASFALSFLEDNSAQAKNAFLGVAPSFNGYSDTAQRTCDEDKLSELYCSEEEVKNVQSMISGSIQLGASASKEAFLSNSSDYKILHLATHACIDASNSLLNRIYFSDGFLTTLELQNLKLSAELVVLSACDTGNGAFQSGEGVISLARSLSYAGCPSSIVSLWSIDDCATSKIITTFYQELAEGKSKNQAIRLAKLNYLENTTDKLQSHPYYWAGLIQTGDSSPIIQAKYNFYKLAAGFVALFICLVVCIYWLRVNRT